MNQEEEVYKCEHCEAEVSEDKDLDEEGLCEECHMQAGQDRAEAWNDLD